MKSNHSYSRRLQSPWESCSGCLVLQLKVLSLGSGRNSFQKLLKRPIRQRPEIICSSPVASRQQLVTNPMDWVLICGGSAVCSDTDVNPELPKPELGPWVGVRS
ncbi:Uncharacterised protein at_DN1329 [Pycnogonum litorale]